MSKFLKLRGREIEIGKKTLVMGILNVTPDSFSDGGNFFSADSAITHAKKILADGADIIDIGAESTRPGFEKISAAEEIARLEKILPAVKKLGAVISVDTYKPEVAEFALESGADFINDVGGLSDEKMLAVAKKFSAPVIAMHNKKISPNILHDVKNFFSATQKLCAENNLQVILDPGIGFGKTQEENLTLLKNLRELKTAENILLLGASRKSFIGHFTGLAVHERDEATGAVCVLAIAAGVDIVRVHNVEMLAKMCNMADLIAK